MRALIALDIRSKAWMRNAWRFPIVSSTIQNVLDSVMFSDWRTSGVHHVCTPIASGFWSTPCLYDGSRTFHGYVVSAAFRDLGARHGCGVMCSDGVEYLEHAMGMLWMAGTDCAENPEGVF